MRDLTPDHPAIEAALDAEARTDGPMSRDTAHYMLEHALPHLESATEENITRLRHTPVGRALLAEGWYTGVSDNERIWIHAYDGHVVDPDDPLAKCQTCVIHNPYEETTNE